MHARIKTACPECGKKLRIKFRPSISKSVQVVSARCKGVHTFSVAVQYQVHPLYGTLEILDVKGTLQSEKSTGNPEPRRLVGAAELVNALANVDEDPDGGYEVEEATDEESN
jgi:hypothetical protein